VRSRFEGAGNVKNTHTIIARIFVRVRGGDLAKGDDFVKDSVVHLGGRVRRDGNGQSVIDFRIIVDRFELSTNSAVR
jgi:hypothetical protein